MALRLFKHAQSHIAIIMTARPPNAATLTPTACALVSVVGLCPEVAAAAVAELVFEVVDGVAVADAIDIAVSVTADVALLDVRAKVSKVVFDRAVDAAANAEVVAA